MPSGPTTASSRPPRRERGRRRRRRAGGRRHDAAPYRDYAEDEWFALATHRGTGSREWDREDLDPKTVVLGIDPDEALGVPRPVVRGTGGALAVTVGGTVVVFDADGFAAFRNPGNGFRQVDGGFAADRIAWDGTTGEADDGRRLDSVPARWPYAFVRQDDHGPDAFLAPPE